MSWSDRVVVTSDNGHSVPKEGTAAAKVVNHHSYRLNDDRTSDTGGDQHNDPILSCVAVTHYRKQTSFGAATT